MASEELAWLPESVRERTVALFAEGLRLPQELVGHDVLEEPAS